ncbi:galactokinase [Congregibacter sp.]|uniref:galactokinase n=1 Tax=Congregibacter sp. TaxID=2744308 RepID=UPI003F6A76D5
MNNAVNARLDDLFPPLEAALRERSAAMPAWAAKAPGRVNLIGDHTDYSEGFALPMGIDLYTLAVASPRDDDAIHVFSTQGGKTTLPLNDDSSRNGDWTDYLRGVLKQYRQRGFSVPAMDVVVGGNLPLGAGLSSSASLELCFATLLEVASGKTVSNRERALLCQKAEHDYAGVPCGILDQFAVTFAEENKAMLLDCRTQSLETVTVPEQLCIAVVDSGVSHALADGGYAERRAQVETAQTQLGQLLRDAKTDDLIRITDETVRQRARHVLSENTRVRTFADALAKNDLAAAGHLMYASHESLSRDFAVSCTELDTLVAAAKEARAIGARMTGGGFGGSMVAFVDREHTRSFERLVTERFSSAGYGEPTIRWVSAVAGAKAWKCP